jgi:YD repeat-containing protein
MVCVPTGSDALAALSALAESTIAGATDGWSSSAVGVAPPQTSFTAWTTDQYSHMQLVSTRVYYNIPASGAGTAAANYNQTGYGYTSTGLPQWTESPSGTITFNVLDYRGLTLSTWVGTDAGQLPEFAPSGVPNLTAPFSSGNMLDVTDYQYDADSDVTSATQHVDSNPSDDRTTSYGYDWRDRQLWTMTNDGTYQTYTYLTYDNLGDVIETQQYNDVDKDGLAAVDATPHADDALIAQSTTAYDSLGQVYQSATYLVAGGTAGAAQTTQYWYDADGNQVALTDPDNNQTTWQYDGLGQQTVETNALAASAHYCYDSAGELVQTTDRDGRAITYAYLCPCQLARLDYFVCVDFDTAGVVSGTAEKRLAGGAGGGNERPCSSARCRRKPWQDALGRDARLVFVLSA